MRVPRRLTVLLTVLCVAGGVARVWNLGDTRFSFDETVTGAEARLSPGRLLDYVRSRDVHPPLDALLRLPIGHHSMAEWPLRLPSAVASMAALCLLAWWLRERTWLAVGSVVVFAGAAFQLTYAWEARMYAVMSLAGVAVAASAYVWIRDGTSHARWLMAAVLLVALFESESALLLAAGLAAVPGLRRDTEAWRWRLTLAAVGAVWLIGWGPALLHQLHNVTAQAPVPFTTPQRFFRTLNELVDYQPALTGIVCTAVLAGGVVLSRVDRLLFRTWAACFVVPLVLAAVLGTHLHLFWVKTFAFASWGPAVALGALCEAAVRRWRLLVAPSVGILTLLVLPSTQYALQHPQGATGPSWGTAVRAMRERVVTGDAVSSAVLAPPVLWYVVGARPYRQIMVAGWSAPIYLVGDHTWDGRIWTLDSSPPSGQSPCAPSVTMTGWYVGCVVGEWHIPSGRIAGVSSVRSSE